MAKPKKKEITPVQPEIEYFIDSEPSSLLEIIENNPDDTIWKEYLEKHNLRNVKDSDSARRYLKEKLGDYLSAKEIVKRTNIKARTLAKWRKQGLLKTERLKGVWYYSFKSVVKAIKTADIKDLR
jgi:hypothetical protein